MAALQQSPIDASPLSNSIEEFLRLDTEQQVRNIDGRLLDFAEICRRRLGAPGLISNLGGAGNFAALSQIALLEPGACSGLAKPVANSIF